MFARALMKHQVIYVSQYLSKDELESMFLAKAETVEQALIMAFAKVGLQSRVLIVPQANDVIPIVRQFK